MPSSVDFQLEKAFEFELYQVLTPKMEACTSIREYADLTIVKNYIELRIKQLKAKP